MTGRRAGLWAWGVVAGLAVGCAEKLPTHLANIGDSISQGFDANEVPQDHPELSWIQGTDETIASVFSRYRALVPELTQHAESVTGAELVNGDDNFAAQAARVCGQDPLPDSVWVLLGGNDVCHRDSSETADATANLYSVENFVAAARSGMTQLSECLPSGATVHVLSVPRVDFIYDVGHAKGFLCPDVVWPAANVCRVVTAETDAGRRDQIGSRVNAYNVALAEEVAAFDASNEGRNPRGIRFETDWKGSIEEGHANTSVGTVRYTPEDINGLDCFHPNVEGQRRLACTAWANLSRGTVPPTSCWE